MASCQFDPALPEWRSSGSNRLTVQEAIEVLRQAKCVGISLQNVSRDALQADRLQIDGEFGRNREGGTGSSSSTRRMVSAAVVPLNGGRPVSIS